MKKIKISRVRGKIRVGRVTPIKQFFFFRPKLHNCFNVCINTVTLQGHFCILIFVSTSNAQISPIKGIFSDSNKVFLCHESEDITKKSLFPKFQLHLSFHFHDYVCFIVHIDYCVELFLFPTKIISA